MVRDVTKGVIQLDTPGQGPDGNSTWPSAGSLVTQLMEAENWVRLVTETPEIMGGVVSIGVGVGVAVVIGVGVTHTRVYAQVLRFIFS